MAGASYWVRYAGVLWVFTFVVLLLVQIKAGSSKKKPPRTAAIVSGALPLLLLMPLMVRNAVLVGDWKGGNNTPAAMPISRLVIDTPKILYHLILGDATISHLWFPMSFVIIGLIGVCVAGFRAKGAERLPSFRKLLSLFPPVTNTGVVLAAFLIYSSGITVIAVRSVISYSSRLFVPVLPHLIALLACGVAFLVRRLPAAAYSRLAPAMSLCLLLGYCMGNYASRMSLGLDKYELTQQALLRPDATGRSIKQFLDRKLRPGDVIAATNGQAAGYALNHPTLSLVGRPYGLLSWTAPELRTELARFGATYLLVFRDARLDPVIEESPFLAALARGASPLWLRLAGFNGDIYVYRVQINTSDAEQALLRYEQSMVRRTTTKDENGVGFGSLEESSGERGRLTLAR